MTEGDALVQSVRSASRALVEAGANARRLALGRLADAMNEIPDLVAGIHGLVDAMDPVDRVLRDQNLPDGMRLQHRTAPRGVVLAHLGSRVEALPRLAALAIHTGNGLIAVTSSDEDHRTHSELHALVIEALAPLPVAAITLLDPQAELSDVRAAVDLVIPPPGVGHVFVDVAADLDLAESIIVDSKADPAHWMDTLLIHRALEAAGAERFVDALRSIGVTLYAGTDCPWDLLPKTPSFGHSPSEPSCTLQMVGGVLGAVDHVNRWGARRTDVIITQDAETATAFCRGVASTRVFVNASTRFAAALTFGPVAIEDLLTTRRLLSGAGSIVGGKPLPFQELK